MIKKKSYDEIEKRFEKMYGSDRSKWSKSIRDKMDEEIFGQVSSPLFFSN